MGDFESKVPRGVSRKLEDALGLTLDQVDSIQAIVAELLILHGDSRPRGSRTRWRPLKQDRRGRHRITMLGETLYDAPVVVGTVITDDFNRADSDDLGADWTEVAGNWAIDTNRLRENANQGGDNRVRNENDLASDDHYAEAVVDSITTNKRRGVACRFAAAAQTFYSFNSRPSSTGARELQKWVNGVETTLATDSTTDAVPFTIRLEVDGSSLDGKIGGTSVVTDTDTDITGNTRCGCVTQNGGSGPNEDEASFFDDFEAGDLAAGVSQVIGQAVDTSVAQPLSAAKTQAIGQAIETDLAQAIAAVKTAPIGQAVETSTAQSIASVKAQAIALATEADTAQPVSDPGGVSQQIGQAAESDSAQPVAALKIQAIGQAQESDVAQALTWLKQQAIGQAVEADSARPISARRQYLIGQAVETDLARALDYVKAQVIGQAVETDTAMAITAVGGFLVVHTEGRTTIDFDRSDTDIEFADGMTDPGFDPSRTFLDFDEPRGSSA